MRAAEGREEVVERFLVRQVHDAEAHPHLGRVRVQQVVAPDGRDRTDDAARCAAGWCRRSPCRRPESGCASRRGSTNRSSVIGASIVANVLAAEEPDRRLLVGRQRQRRRVVGHRSGDEPGVVPPRERRPGAPRSVRTRTAGWSSAGTSDRGRSGSRRSAAASRSRMPPRSGRKKMRVGVPEHGERAEAVVLDEIDPAGEPVDPRMIPRDREDDRRVEQHVEVVRVGRVLVEVADDRRRPRARTPAGRRPRPDRACPPSAARSLRAEDGVGQPLAPSCSRARGSRCTASPACGRTTRAEPCRLFRRRVRDAQARLRQPMAGSARRSDRREARGSTRDVTDVDRVLHVGGLRLDRRGADRSGRAIRRARGRTAAARAGSRHWRRARRPRILRRRQLTCRRSAPRRVEARRVERRVGEPEREVLVEPRGVDRAAELHVVRPRA